MIYKHLILESNGIKKLYLYLDYSYELASEANISKRAKNMTDKIQSYLQNNHINYEQEDIMLVVNDIIIGKVNLSNEKYNEYIDVFEKEKIDIIDIEDVLEPIKDYRNFSTYEIDKYIKATDNKEDKEFISFNNYLMYLISKEIPASYDDEALKVYSVLARTNIIRNLSEKGNVQINVNFYNNALKNLWDKKHSYYFNKLKKIISDTNYQVLYHNDNYFDPLFYNDKYLVPISPHSVNKLAKQGFSYKDILMYFYPDCTLINNAF